MREVLNGVINEQIPDPATDQYKDEKLFKQVVKCHELALNLKIEILREETDEWIDKKDKAKGKKKKENLTLLINGGNKPVGMKTPRYASDTESSRNKHYDSDN